MGSNRVAVLTLLLAVPAARLNAQADGTAPASSTAPASGPAASRPGGAASQASAPAPAAALAATSELDAIIEASRVKAQKAQEAIKGKLAKMVPDLALPWDNNREFLKERFKEIVELGPEATPLLLPLVFAPVHDPNDEERSRNATRVLVMLGVAPYSETLLQALPAASTHTKSLIVRLLAASGDTAAVPALRALVQGAAAPPLLVEAIDGLAQLDARAAVADLLPLLGKEDKRVRRQTLRALQTLGSADVVVPTLAALKAEKDLTLFPHYLDVLVAHAHNSASTAETLIPFLARDGLPESAPEDILHALGLVAPEGHKPSLDALRVSLRSTQQQQVRAAALAMLQLGDASGTKVVLEQLGKFVQQNPKMPRAWLMRGDALLLYGRHADALKDYREAVRVSPRGAVDPPVHVAMARCFAKAKAWGDVVKAIKSAGLTTRELHDVFERYAELREAAEQNPQVKKLIEG